MEEQIPEIRRSVETPIGSGSGDLEISRSQKNVLTEDPAFFLIAHLILAGRHKSISGLKTYFRKQPAIADLVDDVVVRLESVDLLAVSGDSLFLPEGAIALANDPENLKKFLPRLFELCTDRLIRNASAGLIKERREALYYFVLPDTPAISAEAKAIYLEFKAKMVALTQRTESKVGSSGIRMVGVLNCALEAEDFV